MPWNGLSVLVMYIYMGKIPIKIVLEAVHLKNNAKWLKSIDKIQYMAHVRLSDWIVRENRVKWVNYGKIR